MCLELAAHECSQLECSSHLERFFAGELGAPADLLHEPGTHLISSPSREEPRWLGFLVPLLIVGHGPSTVVSIREDLLPAAERLVRGATRRVPPDVVSGLQDLVEARVPGIRRLVGHALYCDSERFRPARAHAVETLPPGGHDPGFFLRHFDGPVFVTRERGGEVSAWSALKLKGEDVWEVSVSTDPRFRGRGLAKAVVSAATEYVLERGRVPLYVHEDSNPASTRVARSLGYHVFAREAFCSWSDRSETAIW